MKYNCQHNIQEMLTLRIFRPLSFPFKINGQSPIDLNELDEPVVVESKPEATVAQ